jgi:TetR/AcrR family transcriptional regulator, regulator of cefoperazone and chloramphenicol sensitivity
MPAKSRARPKSPSDAQKARSARTAGVSGAPPHERARRDRGADTRAQLIEAGLDVFGRLGFEGASTREIAKAAKANLAAIVYHFGGKEGLHRAVAEHVAQSILQRIGPTLAVVGDPAAAASQAGARAMLTRLIENFIEVILGSAEAERWARFIVREQMQPTASFDVIYRFLGGAATVATRLVAAALGRPEDEAIRIRAFTMLGQVLVFRVAQALVMRRMEWRQIGDRERGLIRAVVIGHVNDILNAEGAKS